MYVPTCAMRDDRKDGSICKVMTFKDWQQGFSGNAEAGYGSVVSLYAFSFLIRSSNKCFWNWFLERGEMKGQKARKKDKQT